MFVRICVWQFSVHSLIAAKNDIFNGLSLRPIGFFLFVLGMNSMLLVQHI